MELLLYSNAEMIPITFPPVLPLLWGRPVGVAGPLHHPGLFQGPEQRSGAAPVVQASSLDRHLQSEVQEGSILGCCVWPDNGALFRRQMSQRAGGGHSLWRCRFPP